MSNRNERFECRWRPSPWLFRACCATLLLALCSIFILQLPAALRLALLVACIAHGAWVIPRQVLLTAPGSVTGVRRTPEGWAVLSRAKGWQPVRLRADSLALPALIILRYQPPGRWLARSACIPADALDAETHRRLRLRLRFSRNRFAPPVVS